MSSIQTPMNTFDGVILQRIAQQVQTKRKREPSKSLSPVKAFTKSIEEHTPLPTKKPRLAPPVPRHILVVPQRPTLVVPRLV